MVSPAPNRTPIFDSESRGRIPTGTGLENTKGYILRSWAVASNGWKLAGVQGECFHLLLKKFLSCTASSKDATGVEAITTSNKDATRNKCIASNKDATNVAPADLRPSGPSRTGPSPSPPSRADGVV